MHWSCKSIKTNLQSSNIFVFLYLNFQIINHLLSLWLCKLLLVNDFRAHQFCVLLRIWLRTLSTVEGQRRNFKNWSTEVTKLVVLKFKERQHKESTSTNFVRQANRCQRTSFGHLPNLCAKKASIFVHQAKKAFGKKYAI